jgi:ribosome recycling factor
MIKEVLEEKKKNFDEAVEHFKAEAGKIRTGRANPSLVEGLMVDYYGNKTPLIQIASINTPEPRMLVIQPWSKDSLVSIESAIREANLGINPMNDGNLIRLSIPPLTEDRRKEMVKFLNKKAEESRVSIRTIREETWKKIQQLEADGDISEDDKFSGKDALQKVVDEYNKKIEEISEKKEKEIMTV